MSRVKVLSAIKANAQRAYIEIAIQNIIIRNPGCQLSVYSCRIQLASLVPLLAANNSACLREFQKCRQGRLLSGIYLRTQHHILLLWIHLFLPSRQALRWLSESEPFLRQFGYIILTAGSSNISYYSKDFPSKIYYPIPSPILLYSIIF